MKNKNKALLIVANIATAISSISFFTAGYKMSRICSISGNSIAEAFFNQVGTVSYAFGFAVVLIGIGIHTLLSKTKK